jgi:tRNA threonylcarbamoyladenosine biosynthesis protein TsaB
MHALAIETSSLAGSVACAESGRILATAAFATGLRHAAEMLPKIDALLAEQKWSTRDVQELYVSVGPGSFTGLRIGITWAKTLAMVTGCRLVAVNTSLVLAANSPPDARNLAVIFDARRGKIFAEVFARSQPTEPWQTIRPARLQTMPELLAATPRPLHLLGPGLEFHEVPAESSLHITPAETWQPRIEPVVAIGHAMARRNEFTDPDRLSPIYVRKPEAQEKLEGHS